MHKNHPFIHHQPTHYLLFYTPCAVLILLLLALLFPFTTDSSHAEETISPHAAETSSLSLALDQELILDITPTASGNIGTTSGNVTVSTSSNAGYQLYLDALGSTAHLTNASSTQSQSYISALTTPTSLTNLPANTWGFALTANPADANTNLSSPQGSNTPLVATTSAATDHYYFTLAANIDTSLPAGQYANTLLLSAIANPETITGLRAITYMQEMTSDICAQSNLHDEKQLIDSRDGQSYWVAKLRDGKCWMTQNLALNLTAGQKLTNLETDLNSKTEWFIPTSTEMDIPKTATSNSTTRSWHLGEVVLVTPTRGKACNSAPTANSSSNTGSDSVRSGQNVAENCSDFVNVATGWSPTFDSSTAPDSTWSGTNYNSATGQTDSYTYAGPLSIDLIAKTYDAHYLIGNYYQWNTATANSGENLSSPESAKDDAQKLVDAPDSICPKGWQLPVSGRNLLETSSTYGTLFDRVASFYQLLLAYSYPQANAYVINNGNSSTPILNGILFPNTPNQAHQNVAQSPMYFTRSGFVYPDTASARLLGNMGIYWSSTVSPNKTHAFTQDINGSSIIPANDHNRVAYGAAVRCVAR